jgi:hypothetical protein
VVPRPPARAARRARAAPPRTRRPPARRGLRLGPDAGRSRPLRARVGRRPQPRGGRRRSPSRSRRRARRPRRGAAVRRRDVRRRDVPGRRRAHPRRPCHARRAAPCHPARRPDGRHRPGLPGAVVLARRGQPPLPPLRQRVAGRRRPRGGLGSRRRHPLQQPAPGAGRCGARPAAPPAWARPIRPRPHAGPAERHESGLLGAGTRLPAGLSLLAVLRRSALREAAVC